MPRTTIQLEDEAIALAKAYAARHRLSLGEALSLLVKQGATRPVMTIEKNGLRVPRLDRQSPKVTAAEVERLLDESP
jgi:hypothetical protein